MIYRCAAGPKRLVLTLLLGAFVLTGGCASQSTPETYYALPAGDAPAAAPEDAARSLRIAPVRVARFLNTEGIVMQTSDVAIHRARNHLWAEDLPTQLARSLSRQLSAQLPEVRVLDADAPRLEGGEPRRLQVDVESFNGRYDGTAIVSGRWQLWDGSGKRLESQRFDVVRPLAADGYPALVRSLETAWENVAKTIAEAIESSW